MKKESDPLGFLDSFNEKPAAVRAPINSKPDALTEELGNENTNQIEERPEHHAQNNTEERKSQDLIDLNVQENDSPTLAKFESNIFEVPAEV